MDVLENAIAHGETVLIENIDEDIDPVLDSILGRNTTRKNTAIKVGDREIKYNHKFRFQTHDETSFDGVSAFANHTPAVRILATIRKIQGKKKTSILNGHNLNMNMNLKFDAKCIALKNVEIGEKIVATLL